MKQERTAITLELDRNDSCSEKPISVLRSYARNNSKLSWTHVKVLIFDGFQPKH